MIDPHAPLETFVSVRVPRDLKDEILALDVDLSKFARAAFARELAAYRPETHHGLRSDFLDALGDLTEVDADVPEVAALADRLVHLVVLHGLLPEVEA